MALDPSLDGTYERQEKLEIVPSLVKDRMDVRSDVLASQDVEHTEKPPLSHTEMTERFYATHDIDDLEQQLVLANFTLQYDIV